MALLYSQEIPEIAGKSSETQRKRRKPMFYHNFQQTPSPGLSPCHKLAMLANAYNPGAEEVEPE